MKFVNVFKQKTAAMFDAWFAKAWKTGGMECAGSLEYDRDYAVTVKMFKENDDWYNYYDPQVQDQLSLNSDS